MQVLLYPEARIKKKTPTSEILRMDGWSETSEGNQYALKYATENNTLVHLKKYGDIYCYHQPAASSAYIEEHHLKNEIYIELPAMEIKVRNGNMYLSKGKYEPDAIDIIHPFYRKMVLKMLL